MTSKQIVKYVSVLGGIIILAGSFLPWVTVNTSVGTIELGGLQASGFETLIAGAAVVLATFVARGPRRFNSLAASLSGFLGGGIALRTVFNLQDGIASLAGASQELGAEPTIGIGLIIVLVGAAVAIAGGLLTDPDKAEMLSDSAALRRKKKPLRPRQN